MTPKPDDVLIDKFLHNTCTPEEAGVVLSWLSSPEGQVFAESLLERDITAAGTEHDLVPDHPVPTLKMFREVHRAINAHEQKSQVSGWFGRGWIKIAAAVLIPLLLTNLLIWKLTLKPSDDISWAEVYVPKGEKLQVMFQDGSRVWLNSDTRLRYPKVFAGNERKVILEGEAYFKVNGEKKRPFLVSLSNNLKIKVTGTSFNVRAYHNDGEIVTSLDEGKISLFGDREMEYALLPGQIASYNKSLAKVSIGQTVIGGSSQWKENKLVFENTHLEEVIKTLERWYNVEFVVENKESLHYTYTMKFQNEPLQHVLFGLEKITPIKCEFKNGVVRIRKKPEYR